MTVQVLTRKFTVEQYYKMAATGILTHRDRVELIRGEVVEMSPIGLRHAACVKRLNVLLSRNLGDRSLLGIQDPVILNSTSEPQPDVVLLHPRDDFYASGHPQSQDIFLLIEVADTTIQYDQEIKVPLYAENGVLEVWIVDIQKQKIEVYRQPTDGSYQEKKTFSKGQELSMLAFPEITLSVDEVLS